MPELHQNTVVVTRPPHFPTMWTRETCEHLVAFGLTDAQIAKALRCTIDELKTHYAEELSNGLALVNAQVKNALLHKALYDGDVPAMKLWLMNNADWRGGDAKPLLNQQGATSGAQGELPVHQRSELLSNLLTRATRMKREQEKVIDGEVIEAMPKRTNGNGSGNGTKHR